MHIHFKLWPTISSISTKRRITEKDTTYKIRTEYYENMRPNKHQESPKTNLGEPSL